ncbi:hypothetical protein [Nostoc sp.]|uniref:hypothetical protein n=1 Tax=Nostoc sp. TaxID=1180 RepID=UPI002FF01E73
MAIYVRIYSESIKQAMEICEMPRIPKVKKTPPPCCPKCYSVLTTWTSSTPRFIRFKCNECCKVSRIKDGQVKERVSLLLKPTVLQKIKNEAHNQGISVDELIEEFGRRIRNHHLR